MKTLFPLMVLIYIAAAICFVGVVKNALKEDVMGFILWLLLVFLLLGPLYWILIGLQRKIDERKELEELCRPGNS